MNRRFDGYLKFTLMRNRFAERTRMPVIVWTSIGLMLATICSGCAFSKATRRTESYSTSTVAAETPSAAVTANPQAAPQNIPPPAASSAENSIGRGTYGGNATNSFAAAPAGQVQSVSAIDERFAQQSSLSDSAANGGQKTCPVTGQPLGRWDRQFP